MNNNIERVVTPIMNYSIQMSTNVGDLDVFETLGVYSTEKEAVEAYSNIKVRVVQEAYITIEED